jgi:hypothetical protein
MPNRLEESDLWRQARALVCAVYGVTGRGGFFRDVALRDDVRREAVAFLSRIAESIEVSGAPAARSVEPISAAMVVRLRSYLVVAADQGYLTEVELDGLAGQLAQIARAAERAAGPGGDRAAAPA